MSNPPKLAAKKDFPGALEEAFGIISSACRLVGICRETYRKWYNDDPEFKRLCDEAKKNGEELGLDTAERSLYNNIKDGKEASTFFYLKTRGKHRGYIEKAPEEINNTNLNIDLSTLTDEQLERLLARMTNKI